MTPLFYNIKSFNIKRLQKHGETGKIGRIFYSDFPL